MNYEHFHFLSESATTGSLANYISPQEEKTPQENALASGSVITSQMTICSIILFKVQSFV
jgi:hypothetical protein